MGTHHKVELVVSALIEDEQRRLLMVREAQPDCYGLWNQPAGHVDPGESAAQALLREVREETGYLHVRIDGLSRIYYFIDLAVVRISFHVSLVDRERGPLADDVLEARWFSDRELQQLAGANQLRSPRTELAIRDWRRGRRADEDLVVTVSGK